MVDIFIYLRRIYKKYNPFAKIKPRIVGVLFIASAALTFLSKLFIEILTNRFLGAPTYGDLLVTYNSPTILFSALMLLVLFVQIKPKFNKLITKVTPLVFGIYLIHENEYIRPILKEYLEPITDLPVYIFPVIVISIGAGIFLICLVIEFFRFKLFNLLKIKRFVSFLDELFTKKMNGG